MENCYELLPESNSTRLRREFESPVFDDWLARLADQGLCHMLVSLLLKLERLMRAPLDGPRILAILQQLTGMIRDVADDLPKRPPPRSALRDRSQVLSLEQRLCCLTFKNLKRTLELLDHDVSEDAEGTTDRDAARVWLVGEMLVCLGRQIERGALLGHPCPPGTWLELHDLFYYVRNRMSAAPGPWGPLSGAGPSAIAGFDPETAYKQLLILGVCAEQEADAVLAPDQAEHLAGWARQSELQDPSLHYGALGTDLVEVASDAPARLVPGGLDPVSSAWVLCLPTAFLGALAAAKAAQRPRAAP